MHSTDKAGSIECLPAVTGLLHTEYITSGRFSHVRECSLSIQIRLLHRSALTMDTSNLLALAATIQSHTTQIHEHLKATGQADPSFNVATPDVDFKGVEDVRSKVLEALIELQELLLTPSELLRSVMVCALASNGICWKLIFPTAN